MKKLLLMGVAAVAMSTGGAAYAAFPNLGADTAGPSLFFHLYKLWCDDDVESSVHV